MVGTLDSKDAKPLFKTTSRVLYAEPGYLLFVREHTLVAQKFDAIARRSRARPCRIGEGLGVDYVGLASFSVSRNGVLAFRAGELRGAGWCGSIAAARRRRRSTPSGTIATRRSRPTASGWCTTRAGPERQRRHLDSRPGAGRHVALHVRHRRRSSSRYGRPTAGESSSRRAPRGRATCTSRTPPGPREAEPLLVTPDEKYISDWSRDGRYILYTEPERGHGMGHLRAADDGRQEAIPGRQDEVQRAVRDTSRRRQVHRLPLRTSRAGPRSTCRSSRRRATSGRCRPRAARQAFWRADGQELFYRAGRAADGRAGRDRHRIHGGCAQCSCSRHDLRDPCARPLPSRARWAAVSRPRVARPRCGAAGGSRAELDGGAQEVTP